MVNIYGCVVFLASVYLTVEENATVSQQCLSCICEAISSCDTDRICTGDVCGPFRITFGYWTSAGSPTVDGESPEADTAFQNCARDSYCSVLCVQEHMRVNQEDCNGDGKIDCDDFAAIHKLGNFECKGPTIPGIYGQTYYKCRDALGAANL